MSSVQEHKAHTACQCACPFMASDLFAPSTKKDIPTNGNEKTSNNAILTGHMNTIGTTRQEKRWSKQVTPSSQANKVCMCVRWLGSEKLNETTRLNKWKRAKWASACVHVSSLVRPRIGQTPTHSTESHLNLMTPIYYINWRHSVIAPHTAGHYDFNSHCVYILSLPLSMSVRDGNSSIIPGVCVCPSVCSESNKKDPLNGGKTKATESEWAENLVTSQFGGSELVPKLGSDTHTSRTQIKSNKLILSLSLAVSCQVALNTSSFS